MPLDPEIEAWLATQRGQPPRSSLTIEQTREMMRGMAALAGSPAAVARVEDVTIPGAVKVRQYWPPAEGSGLPVLVWFHGGRFISGGLDSHDGLCRALAAAAGCRVVAADYRLAPEHRFPAAVEDAGAAAAWAVTQSERVAVGGDSAGANLATVAAEGARCQVLVYPMIDATCACPSHVRYATGFGPGSEDMKRGWHEYLGEADPRDPRVSPVFTEDLSSAPPAFVITAEYDSLRDEGELYAERLREAGVPVRLRRYDGTIHGFFAMPGVLGVARRAIADAAAFLKERL